jgi:hypothetical protein
MTKILTTLIASFFAVSAFAAFAPHGYGQMTEIIQSVSIEQQGQTGDMQLAAKKKAPKKKQPKHA